MEELLYLLFLLLVIDVTLVEGTLLDLDLLVKMVKLFISLDQLSRQNIPLIHDHFIVFVLLGLLSLSLLNHIL